MKTQLRFVNEAAPSVENGVIFGTAAVYNRLSNDLGGFREIIRPGAFDKSLREIKEGLRVVDARIQHEGGMSICGSTANETLELFDDGKALNYRAVTPPTQMGRDLCTMVEKKYLRHSSFAFECSADDLRWDWTQNPPVVEVLNCDLIDVAPCSRPAYDDTTVKVRSMMKPPDEMPRFQPQGTRIEMKEIDGRQVVEFHLLDQVLPNWMRKYDPSLVTSGSIVERLAEYPDAERIDLFINSPGGDVFEGLAIYNTLKEHPAPVHVSVRGLAASAASYIAMAGDHIQMGQGTFLMIHNAMTWMGGNAQELRKQASLLDKVDASIAGIYAQRTGRDVKQFEKWMSAETWFTADDAVTNGLADRIAGADSIATVGTEGKRCRDMKFRNIPATLGGSTEYAMDNPAVDLRALREANLRARRSMHLTRK